jgi:hypothetical protein
MITSLLLLSLSSCLAQVRYGTPPENEIPPKLEHLERVISVQHFPKICDPIKKGDTYYWMHTTSILCKESDITITEYGAYLYYNDSWNLRRSYPLKELKSTFGTSKNKMNQAQPYAWTQNYRTDGDLYGGWALWYFIGTTREGQIVCGYETIHTTSNLLKNN